MTESTSSKAFPDFPDKGKGKAKQAPECNCNALTVPHRHTATGIEPIEPAPAATEKE